MFALEERITLLNCSLRWEVQFRNNICAAVGTFPGSARPSLGLQAGEDCVQSAAFLASNLRTEILDPPFIKDPFLFDLSLT